MDKKVILVDFDGTLNSYKSGWDVERPWHLPDPPKPGAIAFIRMLIATPKWEPVIFTTRVWNPESGGDDVRVVTAIKDWFHKHGLEMGAAMSLRVMSRKILCSLIIDDNAYRYEGSYPTPTMIDALTAPRKGK